MSRKNALRKHMLRLPLACGIALLAMPPLGSAQESMKPAPAGGASGTIIVPPATDPGMAKQVPPTGDAKAVKPPPMPVEPDAVRKAAPEKNTGKDAAKMKEGASASPAPRKAAPGPASDQGSQPSSMKDNCKGNAALCK
ncbi:MAG: hypothetical protein ACO1NO_08870 [Burkholderiaceae bacterium]